jgi:hypothetical protein
MTAPLRAIAAHRLPTNLRLPTTIEPDDFATLLSQSESHRVLGLLGAAARDGALELDDEQQEELELRYRAWLTHALRVEALVLTATRTLDKAGIDSRVLKGVALAHTAYDDPSDRVFGDADVLVPGSELSRAARVLTDELEGERAQPELTPGFDDRFGKEVLVRIGSLELDVHRTFVEGGYGMTVQLDDLFAPPYRFPLAAVELESLAMPQRLLHACYAAAFGDSPPRLMSLRDVAQVVRREQPNLIDVLLMARSWRCEAVVAHAITTTWDTLGLTFGSPLVDWARNYRPSRTERLLLAAHQGSARAFTRPLAAIWLLPGFTDRIAYVRSIALPQRSYLEARGLSAGSHVQRAWRRLTG